jgi:hypothetical protein
MHRDKVHGQKKKGSRLGSGARETRPQFQVVHEALQRLRPDASL